MNTQDTKKSKNIALVGTYYEQSHGDALLFDCVRYIYSEIQDDYNLKLNFKIIDLFGKTKIIYDENKPKEDISYKIKKIIKNNMLVKNYIKEKNNLKIYKSLKLFYKKELQKIDMIVIVGGRII